MAGVGAPASSTARGLRPAAELDDGGHPVRLPLDPTVKSGRFPSWEAPRSGRRVRDRRAPPARLRDCGDRSPIARSPIPGGAMLASVHIADLGPRRTLALLARGPVSYRRPRAAQREPRVGGAPRRPVVDEARSGRIALIAMWDDEDALDRFLATPLGPSSRAVGARDWNRCGRGARGPDSPTICPKRATSNTTDRSRC